MPNGKNAGRLFADCDNVHGFGVSHAVPRDPEPRPGDKVRCGHCHRKLLVGEGSTVTEIAEEDCPKCRGTGVELYNPAPFGFNPGNRMEERVCNRCGGEGRVEK